MAIDEICQRGSIREADVDMLRQAFAREAHLSAGDVDALFRVHALARVQHASFSGFFVETMTDYVVRELEPAGYVTSAHAGWLMARVSTAGRVRTKTEHDLLLNVIDKARWVPESLVAFALAQIRDAVVCGEGPLRADGSVPAGVISRHEIEQIRALIFAYGADGPPAITQIEAELMMDIDDALPAGNDTGNDTGNETGDVRARAIWGDLYMKVIANAVLEASGYACPTREEAMSERQPLLASKATAGVLAGYSAQSAEGRGLARLELQRIEIITGERVGEADAARLAARIFPGTEAAEAGARARRSLDILRAAGFKLAKAFEAEAAAAA